MKWVCLSGLIAFVIVVCSIGYYLHKRQDVKAIEDRITEVTTPRQPYVVATESPVETFTDIHAETPGFNPLNLDDETLNERECCPEEEVSELYEYHSSPDSFVDEQSKQNSESDESTGGNWLRQHLIKKHGYSPDIDRYLELTKLLESKQHKGLYTMLEWARLEVKYNPSEDARALLKDFEELAQNPELVIEFSFQ